MTASADRAVTAGILAEAYEAAERDGFAYVADMRKAAGGKVSRAQFDAVIAGLFRARRLNLVPQSCQARLTDGQRDGAVLVGGEMKHRCYWG